MINGLHGRVGKPLQLFPLQEVKSYFEVRGAKTEYGETELTDARLRFIVLNLVYTERFGKSPFKVRFKGNEPHIDHIYPKSELNKKLALETGQINVIGNYRFLGANDNLRKRAEGPASYFSRLKAANIDISKHLLVQMYADDPSKLTMENEAYTGFIASRTAEINSLCLRVINPEIAKVTVAGA